MSVLSAELLTCEHKEEIAQLIKKLNPAVSEYSFANLYLFRRQHDYRILRHKNNVFLQGVTYDGLRYLMPFNRYEEIGMGAVKELMSAGFAFFPIEKSWLEHFNEDEFSITFNEDDSDYIYTRTKIATYPGRHLHKKRNLVKQYRTLYEYKDEPYACHRADDAKKALDKWFELGGAPVEDTDYVACLEAIEHCDLFGLSGQVYYADGQPSGFLLGEELNDHTFVIHFAKGVTTYKGIYTHMYTSLANTLDEKYTVLNFEQDMGKESLRQAKSTYIPDNMEVKYRIQLKGGSK